MPGKPKPRTFSCVNCGALHTILYCKPTAMFCSKKCATGYKRYLLETTRPEVTEFSGRTKLLAGQFIVNEEYYDWLNIYKWQEHMNGYAFISINTNGKNKSVRLHRLLMGAKDGDLIDHENRNKLDNRMSNLRFSNKSLNGLNTDRSDNAKLYTYDKSKQKWAVSRTVNSKRIFHGRFDTEEEAKAVAEIIRSGRRYKKPVVKPTHCKHGHELDDAYFLAVPKRCALCVKMMHRVAWKRRNVTNNKET